MKRIGILALQGDFFKHGRMVELAGHDVIYVKTAEQLESAEALILPGGESTTFLHLIEKLDLRSNLLEFADSKPLFGTCAGLITLGKNAENLPHPTLGLLNVFVTRNAYGRQVDSFVDSVDLLLDGEENSYEGVFIRAPKIGDMGEHVKPLAWYKGDVVMVEEKNILACAFHPELTEDTRIHEYFINNYV